MQCGKHAGKNYLVYIYIYIYIYILLRRSVEDIFICFNTFEADLTLLKNILKLKHKTIKKRSTKMLNFRLLAASLPQSKYGKGSVRVAFILSVFYIYCL